MYAELLKLVFKEALLMKNKISSPLMRYEELLLNVTADFQV